MGNSALRDLAVIEDVSFTDVHGTVVAIDAHNWLYRYLTTTVRWTASEAYTTPDGTEVANLIGIVRGLPKFFEHEMYPVFVFDGAVTDLKEDEIEERRAARHKAESRLEDALDAGDSMEAARLASQTQRLTPTIQSTTRELFEILDIPIIEAPAEGEAQASYMARQGDVDYVGTEDYDALLFGAPYTLRQLTSKGDPERMDFEATLREHEISHAQLVDIAILIGTDFNEGVTGFGPKTALKAIRKHGDLDAVLDDSDVVIPDAPRVQELFLDPPVTDAYEVDTGISPDIAGARSYLTRTWGIPEEMIETGLERLSTAVTQTGLDHWS